MSPIKACLFPSLEAAPPCHAKNTPFVLSRDLILHAPGKEKAQAGLAAAVIMKSRLEDVRRDTARQASRVQPDEYKPNRVRPFVMIREIHTVILPLLVCAITSIDL